MKNFTITTYTGTTEELRSTNLKDCKFNVELLVNYLNFMDASYPGEQFNLIFVRIEEHTTFIVLPVEKESYEDFIGGEKSENDSTIHMLSLLEKYHGYPTIVRRAILTLDGYARERTGNYYSSKLLAPLTFITALDSYMCRLQTSNKISPELLENEVYKLREEK